MVGDTRCSSEEIAMGCKRHKGDSLQAEVVAAEDLSQQQESGPSAANDTDPDSIISVAAGSTYPTPSFIYMPQMVLYQICKHTGDSSILSPLLSTCKTWRETVQSAVQRLSMGSVSQVRNFMGQTQQSTQICGMASRGKTIIKCQKWLNFSTWNGWLFGIQVLMFLWHTTKVCIYAIYILTSLQACGPILWIERVEHLAVDLHANIWFMTGV